MTSNPAGVGHAPVALDRAARIRAAIESEITPLRRAISAIVKAVERGLGRDQHVLRVEEVLNEAVCRALARPESYDPDRPVVPWLAGIARNVLRSEAREAACRQRRSAREDTDAATWDHFFGALSPTGEAAMARIDVEQMLSQLSPKDRKAIECRFLKELGGRELANALDVGTTGAARVRVARALQILRDLYAPDASEVTP